MGNLNENIKLYLYVITICVVSMSISMCVILCVKKFKSSRHELNWFPQKSNSIQSPKTDQTSILQTKNSRTKKNRNEKKIQLQLNV